VLVINSEGIRASLADISTAIADRALMAPHFMDIDAFAREPIRVDLAAKYPQFKVVMLVVAPLEKPSNVQLAITILAGVTRLYPHVGLVIVGDGALSGKLHTYAKKVGMEERIAFETSTDNLSSYFKTARIFIMTAPYEDSDDSIGHAAAASCAIVTTKVGLAPMILEDSVSGFLCEPDDAQRFIASVILMLRKPATCDSIRLNGHLAIEKYMNSDEAGYLNFVKESWEKTISMAAQSSD
jgi:glycosyltransferase involved in cell wall biosynthesis